jgi:hypothetical protein
LIALFPKLQDVRLIKNLNYDAPLLYEDDDNFDHDHPTACVNSKSESVEWLYFDGNELYDYEVAQLCHMFPNLTYLKVDGYNLLEYQLNIAALKKLETFILEVDPSDQYDGLVDEEEKDPTQMFKIEMTDEQVRQLKEFEIYLSQFEGQNLKYLLEHFGSKFEFSNLKVTLKVSGFILIR